MGVVVADEVRETEDNATSGPLPDDRGAGRFRILISICATFVAAVGVVAILGWALDLPVLASLGSGKIPVAPDTALMFVLYSGAILLRTYLPNSQVSYRAGLFLIAAGALIAAVLFVLSLLGIRLEAEHLGFTVVNKPGELQVGYMSPVTAFSFLLSSISYLLSLLSSSKRRQPANIAFWVACSVIVTGSTLVLAYLYGSPILYGTAFIPPAALTSMAFIALGTALLALSAPRARQSLQNLESTRRASYLFFMVFVVLALGIVIAGFMYFRNYESRHRTEIERQLSAIAELKGDELVHWRKERLMDAELFFKNPNFFGLVRNYMQRPDDTEVAARLGTWLQHVQSGHEYDRVFLLDASGRERMSASEAQPISRYLIQGAEEVLRTKKLTFADFYRNEYDGLVYLAILIPIFDERDRKPAVGTLVLRIDPEKYLYPFINRWPTPSKTAETLLVRREGDEALFLNELRFQKNAALNLRRPLAQNELPAAQAVLGRKGIMEGRDYRGVRVIADLRPVADSPWFLVSRMDISEVYGPMREILWMTIVLVLTLLIGAGAAFGMVWRQQLTQFYRMKCETTEALNESRERLGLLIEGVKDHAIIMLDPNGNVMSWNPGAERINGYSEEEIIGRNFSCFYPQEYIEQDKPVQELKEAVAKGRFEGEGWRVRKDGARFWADVVITALYDKDGLLRGFAKITRDVTERKRAEDRLNETLTDLQRSNKELEQFAYVASHDLQEPLRMVASYTQLLAERYENQLDDKAKKFIHYAVDGAVRMQLLINDLLVFSRIGTRGRPPEPVEAYAVLEEAKNNMKMNIDEAKAIITNDVLPEVRADASQLVQVFQNLIGNAVKFRGTDDPKIQISARDEGVEWLFSVNDNGIGMEQQYADKVFVIFQRLHTKEEYPGSGIGLAICKKIVERHGGRIWFESEPGKGTTFYFTIPK